MLAPSPSPATPWATLRTVVVVAGLAFSGTALGVACLDYAGEDYGACPTTSSTGAALGESSDAQPVATTCDAGTDAAAATITPREAGAGSGSESF